MRSSQDNIDFFYSLEPHGWSRCVLFVDGSMYTMGPTHIFENPIELLLNALTAMLAGGDAAEFTWQDEPGEYEWKLERIQVERHKIGVTVSNCELVYGRGGENGAMLHVEVKLKQFCICVLRQMEKIRDLMAEKSFSEPRRGEFPFDAFAEFKRVFAKTYPQTPL